MSSSKRKLLTLEQRVQALKRLDQGKSCRAVAAEFGCGKTQVNLILKNREEILLQWEDGSLPVERKQLKHRKTTYESLNKILYKWFLNARSNNLPMSGKILREKALLLASEMGLNGFQASRGWLDSFQKRYNTRMPRETSNEKVSDDWMKRLPDMIAGYSPEEIFNADETGLFFRAFSPPSKEVEERLTLLLACSSTGEKLQPLVVGKPAMLKGMQGLPLTLKYNEKSMMTSPIFVEWCESLNEKMRSKGRHILLFVDNNPAHPDTLTLSHVKFIFIPPNSSLQPLDAGITSAFKFNYRRRLLGELLAKRDYNESAEALAESICMSDVLQWILFAWESVSDMSIAMSFQTCGFPVATTEASEPYIEITQEEMSLLGDTSWEVFLSMDDKIPTAEVDDGWEEDLLAQAKKEKESMDVIDSKTALKYMEAIKTLAIHSRNSKLEEMVTKCYVMLVEHHHAIKMEIDH